MLFVLFFSFLFFSFFSTSPTFLFLQVGCSDVLLIIVQIIAILADGFGFGAVVWVLVGGASWNKWILSIYVLFFCLFQMFLEIIMPHRIAHILLIFTRFWGRGLLLILTGMILISMGDPNTSSPGQLIMAFAAGVVMFGVGSLYFLIAVFSCCKCMPISCCSRCGRGVGKADDNPDLVYHEYK